MPAKLSNVDVDNLVELYRSGDSYSEVAKKLGVSASFVRKRLVEHGVELRPSSHYRRHVLDTQRVVRRYLSGESEKAVAGSLGVSRQVIRRVLLESGITPRNRSDAMFTRMANTSPDERSRLSAAAHDAVRGMKRTDAEMEARARVAQRIDYRVSPLEGELAELLRMRGVETVPQLAVGRYNLDLAAWPVAVEVHHTAAHPMVAYGGRGIERTMYLADRGWRTLYIWINPRTKVKFTDRCADEVVSLLNLAESDPSVFGEYRVIRGTGEDATGRHADRYQRANVRSSD